MDLWYDFIDLVSVHARNMLQKIQLQQVNWMGKVIVGMLTKKEGIIALPVRLKMIGWLVQSELPILISFPLMLTK